MWTGYGANPASYSMGSGVSFLGVKWPGHEVDYSPQSNMGVKNDWLYMSETPCMPS
jgi:hypothetical protein